jgi:hypothetical protein
MCITVEFSSNLSILQLTWTQTSIQVASVIISKEARQYDYILYIYLKWECSTVKVLGGHEIFFFKLTYQAKKLYFQVFFIYCHFKKINTAKILLKLAFFNTNQSLFSMCITVEFSFISNE